MFESFLTSKKSSGRVTVSNLDKDLWRSPYHLLFLELSPQLTFIFWHKPLASQKTVALSKVDHR